MYHFIKAFNVAPKCIYYADGKKHNSKYPTDDVFRNPCFFIVKNDDLLVMVVL